MWYQYANVGVNLHESVAELRGSIVKVTLFLLFIAFVVQAIDRARGHSVDGGANDEDYGINPASLLPLDENGMDSAGNIFGIDNRTGSIGAFGMHGSSNDDFVSTDSI